MHVHSAAAKPRILRALPGVLSDARLASGADCATAEAAVRHHNLLCETFDEGSNAAAHHAAAVDVYLEHLESLAVPHASEHAKMAACRPLEQACLECGPRRFVAALGRWLYPRVLIRSASICTKSRTPRATHHHHLRSPMSIAPRATRLTTASPKPPHKRNHHQKVDDEAVSLSSLSSSSPESSDCAKNSRITALCIALSLTFRDRSSS